MARVTPRKLFFGSQFKRDIKKQYAELATTAWAEVLHCLANDLPLAERYKDHALTGDLKGSRDCHVKPDLVLIYEKPDDEGLILSRLGSHSELKID